MQLLLIGATGLVGSHVLKQALTSGKITKVIALTRTPLPEQPKLLNPQIDFAQLPADASWWRSDAVICTLGTTMAKAGSKAAFRKVDHDYPLRIAELTREHGAQAYALNSAVGANPNSRIFYNRVKGETERDLATLGFPSLTFVRPALIAGDRSEFRLTERLGVQVLGAVGPLLPKGWRVNQASRIANALLTAVIAEKPGTNIIASKDLA